MQQFVVRCEIPSNYADDDDDDDDVCDKNMEVCNYSLRPTMITIISPSILTSHINKSPTWSPDLRTAALY